MLTEHRADILRVLAMGATVQGAGSGLSDLIRNPGKWVPRIAEFLGDVPNPEAMYAAIRPELHRNQSALS